jgi:hypothetical protein
VCSDLDITISADIPSMLRMLPFFQESGEFAIKTSVDLVESGSQAGAYTRPLFSST